MSESIKQLRKICQEERNKEYEKMGWLVNWLITGALRKASIYFTKLFLKIGISANQVTLLSFLVGIIAGVFLTFANPRFWIVGGLLYCLHFLFDTCDGEIARYTKSSTTVGAFFDDMNVAIIWPYIVACMSFGVYSATGTVIPLAFGFLAIICLSSYNLSPLMAYRLLGLEGQTVTKTKQSLPETLKHIPSLFKTGFALFSPNGLAIMILVFAVVDCFTPSFTIDHTRLTSSLTVNARCIYLIVYSMAWLVGGILTIYYVAYRMLKHGQQP